MPTVEAYSSAKKPGTWWRARLSIGTDPLTGKFVRKSELIKAPTKETAYKRALALEIKARDEFVQIGSGTMTFRELAEEWWATNPKQNEQATRRAYRYQLDAHILPELGDARLKAITRPVIYRWLHQMPKGVKPATRNRHFAIVRSICRWGTNVGHFANGDPSDGIERLTTEAPEIEAPTLDEVNKVFKWLGDRRPELALAIWVALDTGMRRGELMALRWQDIDTEAGLIHVRSALNPDRTLKAPKTNQQRTVGVQPATIARLELLADAQAELVALAEGRDVGRALPHWHLWHSVKDGAESPMDPNLSTRWLKKASRAVGVNVHMHGLRHLAATTMIVDKGIDPVTVAGKLGHSTPHVTIGVYSHATGQSRDQSRDAMESTMGELGAG